jgi:hypothetical protein
VVPDRHLVAGFASIRLPWILPNAVRNHRLAEDNKDSGHATRKKIPKEILLANRVDYF